MNDDTIQRVVEEFIEQRPDYESDFPDESPDEIDAPAGTFVEWPPAPPRPAAQPEGVREAANAEHKPDV